MLTQDQALATIAGACFVLRFLVDTKRRHLARAQMPGFSDAAIFHRWMILAWSLRESDASAILTPDELRLVAEFNAVYDSISWVPLETHPFISDTSKSELNQLMPIAGELLELLDNRIHK